MHFDNAPWARKLHFGHNCNNRNRNLTLLAVLATVIGLAACGSDPAPNTTATDASASIDVLFGDTGGGEDASDAAGQDVSTLPDSAQADGTQTDATQTDAAKADNGNDDATLPEDATSVVDPTAKPWQCESPGDPGCACKGNGDCNSGHCIQTPDQGQICTALCNANCPAGYVCVAEGDIDTTYLCRPRWPVLCNPCDSDADCAGIGVGKILCAQRGALGNFCGAACNVDADCPSNFNCQSVTSVGGKVGTQCLPAPGKDGAETECTCSVAAKDAKLGTSCTATPSGQGAGTCGGVRQCGPTGLSACSAVPKGEVCNGLDDDCNGQTDDITCDDKNPCTTDLCDPVSTACSHTATEGNCDADGNACTVGDGCKDGTCLPGAPKKCDDGNPCTLDVCDIAKGCTATNDDGSGCDDGELCTIGDVCAGGQCVPGKAKLCPQGADCQVIACSSVSGKCEAKDQADGAPCDDESLCSTGDACKAGSCKGDPTDCNDNNPCTQDACDALKGCQHPANTASCDDGNACTELDTCTFGQCLGKAKPLTACDDGNPCTSDGCEPLKGCGHVDNQLGCNDGNPCTQGDVCAAGKCTSGTSICQCEKDADCKDDGDLCNGTMYCDKSTPSYQCKVNPATVKTCAPTTDACQQAVCVPATGSCSAVNAADGKACDADGSVCSVDDQCAGGKCKPGATLPCDDGKLCTTDGCDAKSGCVHTNNALPCDADGSKCTDQDACVGGACIAGKPLNCDDNDPCTADSCANLTGCAHVTQADGTECGTFKVCKVGACVPQIACGDGIINGTEQCDDGNAIAGDGCTGCKLDVVPQAKAGDILITEVMAAPLTASDEWVEVLNITTHDVDLNGLYFGDKQFYVTLNKAGGFIVKPGQYVVIAAVGNPSNASISPELVYGYNPNSSIAFGNSGDEACISTDQACATGIVARIAFGSQTSGYSYQLSASKLDAASAKLAASWCKGSVKFGNQGDFGTPKAANGTCP